MFESFEILDLSQRDQRNNLTAIKQPYALNNNDGTDDEDDQKRKR
jgi:hypothetical protein